MLEDKDRETLKLLTMQYHQNLLRLEERKKKEVPETNLAEAPLSNSGEKFKDNEKNLNEERLKKESKVAIPYTIERGKMMKSSTPLQMNDMYEANKRTPSS